MLYRLDHLNACRYDWSLDGPSGVLGKGLFDIRACDREIL